MQRRMTLLAIVALMFSAIPAMVAAKTIDGWVDYTFAEPDSEQFLGISVGSGFQVSASVTNISSVEISAYLSVDINGEGWSTSDALLIAPDETSLVASTVFATSSVVSSCGNPGYFPIDIQLWVDGTRVDSITVVPNCTVANTPPPTTPVIVPDIVTIYPVCGPNNDLYTIGATPVGLIYQSESGWVDGILTVSWTAAEGYHIQGPSTRTYTDEGIPCTPVSPVAPTQTMVCGPDNDLIELADQPAGIDGMEFETWHDGVYKIYYYPGDGYEIPAGMDIITLRDTGECPDSPTSPDPTAVPTAIATSTATAGSGGSGPSSIPPGSGGTGGSGDSSSLPGRGGDGGSGGASIPPGSATGGSGGSGDSSMPGSGGSGGAGGSATSGTGGSGPSSIPPGSGGSGGAGGSATSGSGGSGASSIPPGSGGAGGDGGNAFINTIIGSGGGGGIIINDVPYTILETSSIGDYCSGPMPGISMTNTTFIVPSSNAEGDCHGGIYLDDDNQPISMFRFSGDMNLESVLNVLQGSRIHIYDDIGTDFLGFPRVTIWTAIATESTATPYGTTVVGENNIIDLSDLPVGTYRLSIEPDDAEAFDIFVRVVDPNAVTSLPNTGTGHVEDNQNLLLMISGVTMMGLLGLSLRLRGKLGAEG